VTTDAERNALTRIATSTSADDLKKIMKNAKAVSQLVYHAAFRRLIDISTEHKNDPVARACWKMVHTVEQIRRENGRSVYRMNRLRPKIERDGERAALDYCANNRTDGFQEILDYKMPEYTAEAIVLGYLEEFSEATKTAARKRLADEGINPAIYEGRPLI